jgi:rod shape-determining protein MreD
MYQNIFIFIIILFSILLQTAFFPNLIPFDVFPDVALIVILFWTIQSGFEETWKWATMAGLIVDLAYFLPVGTSIFSFVLVAYIINFLAKRFLVSGTVFRFFILASLVIFGTFLNEIFIYAIMALVGKDIIAGNSLLLMNNFLLKILYNFIIFTAAYIPLKRLEKFLSSLRLRSQLI